MKIKEKITKVKNSTKIVVVVSLLILMTVTIIVSKKYIATGADAPTTEAVLTRRRSRVVLTGQRGHWIMSLQKNGIGQKLNQ